MIRFINLSLASLLFVFSVDAQRSSTDPPLRFWSYTILRSEISIGFETMVQNTSPKPIEQIQFHITAFNTDGKRIKSTMATAHGPLKPGYSASFDFDRYIVTFGARTLVTDSVVIQYTDGTGASIPGSDLLLAVQAP